MYYVISNAAGLYYSTLRGWVEHRNDATMTTDVIWAARLAVNLGAELISVRESAA
jgi:hypothetical protein